MAKDKLTAKQEAFCQYVAGGDTYADAYRKAYDAKKMGTNTIYVKASQFMDQDKIRVRVDEVRKEVVERNHVTIDEVLNELANWIRFDPLDIVDPDTDAVKRLADMDKRARMSLAEIQVTELFENVPNIDGKKERTKVGELKKIKFVDKRATAEMFMKKFGQYVDEKNDVSSNLDAIKEIIEQIKK